MTSSAPRRFYLDRSADPTGVSGTGRVADGVLWADGSASVRWRGDRPSTVWWASLADVLHVHTHGGGTNTRIVWLDFDEAEVDPDLPCLHCIDGHPEPTSRTWGVRVSPERHFDGKPAYLRVEPSAGGHVGNEDARWLHQLIRVAGGLPPIA